MRKSQRAAEAKVNIEVALGYNKANQNSAKTLNKDLTSIKNTVENMPKTSFTKNIAKEINYLLEATHDLSAATVEYETRLRGLKSKDFSEMSGTELSTTLSELRALQQAVSSLTSEIDLLKKNSQGMGKAIGAGLSPKVAKELEQLENNLANIPKKAKKHFSQFRSELTKLKDAYKQVTSGPQVDNKALNTITHDVERLRIEFETTKRVWGEELKFPTSIKKELTGINTALKNGQKSVGKLSLEYQELYEQIKHLSSLPDSGITSKELAEVRKQKNAVNTINRSIIKQQTIIKNLEQDYLKGVISENEALDRISDAYKKLEVLTKNQVINVNLGAGAWEKVNTSILKSEKTLKSMQGYLNISGKQGQLAVIDSELAKLDEMHRQLGLSDKLADQLRQSFLALRATITTTNKAIKGADWTKSLRSAKEQIAAVKHTLDGLEKSTKTLHKTANSYEKLVNTINKNVNERMQWAPTKALDAAEKAGKHLEVRYKRLIKLQELYNQKISEAKTPEEAHKLQIRMEKAVKRATKALEKEADAYGKILANLKQLSAAKWVKNIAKRATAYASIYFGMFQLIKVMRDTISVTLEYDQAIHTMGALFDISREKAKALEDSMHTLGRAYGGSIPEINEVAYSLGRAGIAVDDLVDATAVVIKMAKLTGDSIGESASAIITYQQVFGDTKSITELGDQLAYVANQSRLSTKDIGTYSNYALAAVKASNMTLEAVNALAVSFSNAGLNASTIGTQIRRLTNVFIDNSSAVKRFFTTIGVAQKSFVNTMHSSAQASDKAMEMLIDRIAGLSDVDFQNSLRGMDILAKQSLTLLRNNGEAIKEHLHTLQQGVDGEINKAILITESYIGTWEKLKNAVTTAAAELGDSFFPYIKSGMEIAIQGMQNLRNNIDLVTNSLKLAGTVLAGLAIASTVKNLAAIGGWFSKIASGAMTAVNAFKALPLGHIKAVTLAIVGLATVTALLYNNSKGVTAIQLEEKSLSTLIEKYKSLKEAKQAGAAFDVALEIRASKTKLENMKEEARLYKLHNEYQRAAVNLAQLEAKAKKMTRGAEQDLLEAEIKKQKVILEGLAKRDTKGNQLNIVSAKENIAALTKYIAQAQKAGDKQREAYFKSSLAAAKDHLAKLEGLVATSTQKIVSKLASEGSVKAIHTFMKDTAKILEDDISNLNTIANAGIDVSALKEGLIGHLKEVQTELTKSFKTFATESFTTVEISLADKADTEGITAAKELINSFTDNVSENTVKIRKFISELTNDTGNIFSEEAKQAMLIYFKALLTNLSQVNSLNALLVKADAIGSKKLEVKDYSLKLGTLKKNFELLSKEADNFNTYLADTGDYINKAGIYQSKLSFNTANTEEYRAQLTKTIASIKKVSNEIAALSAQVKGSNGTERTKAITKYNSKNKELISLLQERNSLTGKVNSNEKSRISLLQKLTKANFSYVQSVEKQKALDERASKISEEKFKKAQVGLDAMLTRYALVEERTKAIAKYSEAVQSAPAGNKVAIIEARIELNKDSQKALNKVLETVRDRVSRTKKAFDALKKKGVGKDELTKATKDYTKALSEQKSVETSLNNLKEQAVGLEIARKNAIKATDKAAKKAAKSLEAVINGMAINFSEADVNRTTKNVELYAEALKDAEEQLKNVDKASSEYSKTLAKLDKVKSTKNINKTIIQGLEALTKGYKEAAREQKELMTSDKAKDIRLDAAKKYSQLVRKIAATQSLLATSLKTQVGSVLKEVEYTKRLKKEREDLKQTIDGMYSDLDKSDYFAKREKDAIKYERLTEKVRITLEGQGEVLAEYQRKLKQVIALESYRYQNAANAAAGFKMSFAKYLQDSQQTVYQVSEDIGNTLTSSLESSFDNFFDYTSDQWLNWGSLAKSVINDVAKTMIHDLVTKDITRSLTGSLLNMFGGSSGGSGLFAMLGLGAAASSETGGAAAASARQAAKMQENTNKVLGKNIAANTEAVKNNTSTATQAASVSVGLFGADGYLASSLTSLGDYFAGMTSPIATVGSDFFAGSSTVFGGTVAGTGGEVSTSMLAGEAVTGAAVGYLTGMLGDMLMDAETYAAPAGAVGAMIGTYIEPGIGTAVGAILGSVIGGIFGKKWEPDVAGISVAREQLSTAVNEDAINMYQEFVKKGWFSKKRKTVVKTAKDVGIDESLLNGLQLNYIEMVTYFEGVLAGINNIFFSLSDTFKGFIVETGKYTTNAADRLLTQAIKQDVIGGSIRDLYTKGEEISKRVALAVEEMPGMGTIYIPNYGALKTTLNDVNELLNTNIPESFRKRLEGYKAQITKALEAEPGSFRNQMQYDDWLKGILGPMNDMFTNLGSDIKEQFKIGGEIDVLAETIATSWKNAAKVEGKKLMEFFSERMAAYLNSWRDLKQLQDPKAIEALNFSTALNNLNTTFATYSTQVNKAISDTIRIIEGAEFGDIIAGINAAPARLGGGQSQYSKYTQDIAKITGPDGVLDLSDINVENLNALNKVLQDTTMLTAGQTDALTQLNTAMVQVIQATKAYSESLQKKGLNLMGLLAKVGGADMVDASVNEIKYAKIADAFKISLAEAKAITKDGFKDIVQNMLKGIDKDTLAELSAIDPSGLKDWLAKHEEFKDISADEITALGLLLEVHKDWVISLESAHEKLVGMTDQLFGLYGILERYTGSTYSLNLETEKAMNLMDMQNLTEAEYVRILRDKIANQQALTEVELTAINVIDSALQRINGLRTTGLSKWGQALESHDLYDNGSQIFHDWLDAVNDEIKAVQAQIDYHKGLIEDAKRTIDGIKDQIDYYKDLIGDAKDLINDYKDQIKPLADAIKEYDQRISTLDSILDSLNSVIDSLRQTVESIYGNQLNGFDNLRYLKDLYENTKMDATAAKAVYESNIEDKDSADAYVKALNEFNAAAGNYAEALKKNVSLKDAYERNYKRLLVASSLTNMQGSIEGSKGEIENKKSDINDLKAPLQQQVDQLNDLIKGQEDLIKGYEAQIKPLEDQIDYWDDFIDGQNRIIDGLEAQIGDLNARADAIRELLSEKFDWTLKKVEQGGQQLEILIDPDGIIQNMKIEGFLKDIAVALGDSIGNVSDLMGDAFGSSIQDLRKFMENDTYATMDWNKDGLVDAVRTVNPDGSSVLRYDWNNDNVIDVEYSFDESGILQDIQYDTAMTSDALRNGVIKSLDNLHQTNLKTGEMLNTVLFSGANQEAVLASEGGGMAVAQFVAYADKLNGYLASSDAMTSALAERVLNAEDFTSIKQGIEDAFASAIGYKERGGNLDALSGFGNLNMGELVDISPLQHYTEGLISSVISINTSLSDAYSTMDINGDPTSGIFKQAQDDAELLGANKDLTNNQIYTSMLEANQQAMAELGVTMGEQFTTFVQDFMTSSDTITQSALMEFSNTQNGMTASLAESMSQYEAVLDPLLSAIGQTDDIILSATGASIQESVQATETALQGITATTTGGLTTIQQASEGYLNALATGNQEVIDRALVAYEAVTTQAQSATSDSITNTTTTVSSSISDIMSASQSVVDQARASGDATLLAIAQQVAASTSSWAAGMQAQLATITADANSTIAAAIADANAKIARAGAQTEALSGTTDSTGAPQPYSIAPQLADTATTPVVVTVEDNASLEAQEATAAQLATVVDILTQQRSQNDIMIDLAYGNDFYWRNQ
jgi:chromosome segregation ATPase